MRLDEKYPNAEIILRTNRGGIRDGSGRKPKPYKTKTIAFRVRIGHIDQLNKLLKDAAKLLDAAEDQQQKAPKLILSVKE